MDAHELILGKYLLQILQGEQGRDAALRGVEGHILMLPFNEEQVVVIDFIQFVVGLYSDEVIRLADGVSCGLLNAHHLLLFGTNGLVDGLDETGKVERFEQIVDHREIESIDCIFGIRACVPNF